MSRQGRDSCGILAAVADVAVLPLLLVVNSISFFVTWYYVCFDEVSSGTISLKATDPDNFGFTEFLPAGLLTN